jgi:hypothetical protein
MVCGAGAAEHRHIVKTPSAGGPGVVLIHYCRSGSGLLVSLIGTISIAEVTEADRAEDGDYPDPEIRVVVAFLTGRKVEAEIVISIMGSEVSIIVRKDIPSAAIGHVFYLRPT